MLIQIEDIKNAKNGVLKIEFNQPIEEVGSTPVVAHLEMKDLGEFIEVQGHVSSQANFECDVCLSEFVYEIDFEIDEMFAKNSLYEEYSAETELSKNELITDLCGAETIDIYDLLYQSVILDFPNKKVCGINCKVDTFASDEAGDEVKGSKSSDTQDPRLAIFKNIHIEKEN